MSGPFELRGIVEGFYGPPWSHEARLEVLSFLAGRGMNAYVYAPKDDDRHRKGWRTPYPAGDFDALLATAAHCRDVGMRFAYGLAPGLDIDYSAPADRDALWAKLRPFVDGGVDWLVLAFDDVPLKPGSGRGQADLVRWLRERTDARLTVVPTDYVGTHSSPYLDELCPALPPDVDVMWTGTTVVPRTITRAEAQARRAATADLPLLIWDNYPVNDAFMTASLHMGPLVGRDPALSDVCVGVLANPMPLARASLLPLATVAAYLNDPEGYDAPTEWDAAIEGVGQSLGGRESVVALRALARACSGSILAPHVPLHEHIDQWEKDGFAAPSDALGSIRAELDRAAVLPAGLPAALIDEVRPWAEQAGREAQAGLSALDAATLGADPSVARSTDPWSAALSVMGALFLWSSARSASDKVAFGARFACYPGIVLDRSGSVRVDPDLSLIEDANAIDRLCRIALRLAAAPSTGEP